ncbi:MAG: hypothetical protein DME06_14760 [Candidatus Rokuibacteriota bacterium]|nr:MAG: hypothetical protein DME06_14760 [Candidatus Rokubacteria bacterium]
MVNVPSSVWIDERGRLVRWGEVAFVDNRWQALYAELRELKFVVLTVAQDSRGAETAGEWIRAARPEHPALIDRTHRVAALYGMVNVPSIVWIDERGRLVRWGEVAFVDNRPPLDLPSVE